MAHLYPGYLYKFCLTAIGCLISTIGLFSQDIKSVWFTESGQMVCKMCPGKPNYQLNYVGTNCNKWEVVAVLNSSYNVQNVKLLNRTINNPNQVQQIVTIDSGFHEINAVKFKKKGSSQTIVYDLKSKGTPPVFVGYHCNFDTSREQRRIWFSQNGIMVISLCAEKGLYQMNVEAHESFNFDYINSLTGEQFIKSVGPKRIISPNKFQQDVSVNKSNGIITFIAISSDSIDAHGHRYRSTIQLGKTGQESSFQPVFVGYHCY